MAEIGCPCCKGSGNLDLSTPSGMRAARIALGLTGKEAAEVLLVHPTTISNFEHGHDHMGREKVERYRRWLLSQAA